MKQLLSIATVTQSLALQSPAAWDVARRFGYQVTFAARPDEWAGNLPEGDLEPLPLARKLSLLSLTRLGLRLRELSLRDWDLVVVQTPIPAAIFRLVAPVDLLSRTIYYAHGFHFYDGSGLGSLAFKMTETMLARRTHVAVVNGWDESWLRRLPSPLQARSVTRLPGAGVNTSRFASGTPLDDRPSSYALFVGEINANKDPMHALAVVGEARARGRELELVVIGDGPLLPKLVEASRTREWLHIVRRSSEVDRWLVGADVLLAPSYREGLPRVIIEAMAAGVPILSRRNRGASELLSQHPNWLLNPRAGVDEWVRTLELVLDSSVDRAELRTSALAYDTTAFEAAFARLLGSVATLQGAQS